MTRVLLAALLFTGSLSAQVIGGVASSSPVRLGSPETAGPTGSVMGRVVCTDTQHAARFAQVTLMAAVTTENVGRGWRLTGRTDLDGNFVITGVPVGDYYATATATGYISEAALMQAAGGDQATVLRTLPQVHVANGGSSTVNLSLDRGSVIAGRIMWDDGTPAAGVQVSVVTPASTLNAQPRRPGFVSGNFMAFGSGVASTDDRGNFRLTGLAPGAYMVRAIVQVPTPQTAPVGDRGGNFSRTDAIQMYAPGKIRATDARTITVASGEEKTDIPFTLDLHALHTVSGHVSSSVDSVNVSAGTVTITDQQDTTLSPFSQIGTDGSFVLSYVPEGTYTMSVPYASSSSLAAPTNANSYGGRRGRGNAFQPFHQTLTVTSTDVTNVPVTLTPAQPAAQ